MKGKDGGENEQETEEVGENIAEKVGVAKRQKRESEIRELWRRRRRWRTDGAG